MKIISSVFSLKMNLLTHHIDHAFTLRFISLSEEMSYTYPFVRIMMNCINLYWHMYRETINAVLDTVISPEAEGGQIHLNVVIVM